MTPPASAKDQVARLLTLVPYLHAHGEVRVDEAARALGVAPEQLFRDLKVLFMCGLPGGYPDDLIDVDIDALEGPDGVRADGVIKVSNADYLARPLRLSPTEASAVIVALRALRNGAKDDTREVLDRALAKLEAAAAEGGAAARIDPARIDPGTNAADADLALLASRLQTAADRGRRVRLSYYVPSRDEQSERVVDPRGVVTAQGHLYLDAWCHSAEAPRLFRLDRIDRDEVLDEPVETPQEGPRDLGDGIFSQSSDVTAVTILLEPEARWMTSYYPVEEIREVGQERMEVVLLVADERWLTRLMLRLAPHARVLSPSAYAETFRSAAQRALSLYGAETGTVVTTAPTL
ncbi:MAG TPA: WYL domain-containing protein [Nocardioides sp.]|uniref:helix-turn-helix transcriptional regulator n=1 Tax=uncultured Nocardioides sp. TaxID=198441 RepID=UPI000EE26494|nr:WYL domain-containing protein [uncultured Nocardioides sp.]HCB06187.1 WYL domain-containing protein [Nocardioides sp.]HRD60138.1 WYL domain-containing protein [Nocardioides sp.]HRI94259.1 WYL domain-containing protein [Nocardioides sp.]HRK44464.1 WYL domain-containing protein [Nocardioides sp.]